MWSAEGGGSVHSKIVLFHQGSTELRRCENCVFFLPVNVLTGVTRELVKRGITELRNNEISKTYLLQIVQIVICSIVIILYLPCNSSAWRTTVMDKTAAGEH